VSCQDFLEIPALKLEIVFQEYICSGFTVF